MKQNNKLSDIQYPNENKETITYTIENNNYIVHPIHKKSGETIFEILIKLMKKDTEEP